MTDYEYTVWDDTRNQPVPGSLSYTLWEAEEAWWYEEKYGLYAGSHDHSIRRRPRAVEWEAFE